MNTKSLLNTINSPADLKRIPKKRLPELAREVRDLIITTVAEKGGHLGAGLGATDIAIALHYVLNTPHDFLVWDVGHQVQAHKILTGRRDAFRESFRQYKGISGLANKDEGPYDPFTTGHGGPSISSGLGVATAKRLLNRKGKTVVVIGDTSIASGMAFEAMNLTGHTAENLVVILNDNEMSISPSVGAMSKYLNRIISNPTYNNIRGKVERLIRRLPQLGRRVIGKVREIEEDVKHLLVPGRLFEDLGFRYFGPLDGHNVIEMVNLFPNIFKIKGPILIHAITKKGKGLEMAEKDPVRWHASTPFEISTGKVKKKSKDRTYTQAFGEAICALAEKNPKITALTGGMMEGTGLKDFSQRFPDRFFDVGISEEHGVTFCAGLAHEGMRPVAAIYSTFLQRAFDQMIHDVALQKLPVMFCMDRAGLVGEDGPTHHGVFDIAYLRQIPHMSLLAPRDGVELEAMLGVMARHLKGPVAMRYPRGAITEVAFPELLTASRAPIEWGKAETLRTGDQVLFLALGSMVGPSLRAAQYLEEKGITSTVVNTRFVKPLDEELILRLSKSHAAIVTLEEGCRHGGFGTAVLQTLVGQEIDLQRVACLGIPDHFIEGGSREILLDQIGLSPEKIAKTAQKLLQKSKSTQKSPSPKTSSKSPVYSV